MGKKTAPNISMLIIRRSPKLHREKLAILLILVMKIAAATTTTLSKKDVERSPQIIKLIA